MSENIKLWLTDDIYMDRIVLNSIWSDAKSGGRLQEWNNQPKHRCFIQLIWLKADWLDKMCSTENRDFIHTSYTKIHCIISQSNEVLPFHKHQNSGPGKKKKKKINNVRCLEYSSSRTLPYTTPPPSVGHRTSATHSTTQKWKLDNQKSNAASKRTTYINNRVDYIIIL